MDVSQRITLARTEALDQICFAEIDGIIFPRSISSHETLNPSQSISRRRGAFLAGGGGAWDPVLHPWPLLALACNSRRRYAIHATSGFLPVKFLLTS